MLRSAERIQPAADGASPEIGGGAASVEQKTTAAAVAAAAEAGETAAATVMQSQPGSGSWRSLGGGTQQPAGGRKEVVVLDVRNGYEWDAGHFQGSERPLEVTLRVHVMPETVVTPASLNTARKRIEQVRNEALLQSLPCLVLPSGYTGSWTKAMFCTVSAFSNSTMYMLLNICLVMCCRTSLMRHLPGRTGHCPSRWMVVTLTPPS